jgi:FkbM family methyltransferase
MDFLKTAAKLLPAAPRQRFREFLVAELRGPAASFVRSRQVEIELTLDLILSHYRLRHPDVYFLQVGANDGVTFDPIFPLIERHSLKGTLIEPQPDCYNKLKDNYARFGKSDFLFVNAAIAAIDGTLPLYRIRVEPHVPERLSGIASFNRAVLMKHKAASHVPDFESLIQTDSVRCVSFPSLFNELNLQHVDLLQIDAEGYDSDVLHQFDVPRRKPAIVRFEHIHLRWEEHKRCLDLLISNNYKVAVDKCDTVAYREDY